jgi:hypothetical protein
MEGETRHQCLIYEGPPSKGLSALTEVICKKLAEGYCCLYLNSAPMVAGIRSYLSSKGIDVSAEIANGSLVISSEPVSVGKQFEMEKMLSNLEGTLDQALKDGYKGLWASGDLSWEFGSDRSFAQLLEYEWRLEEIFRRRPELCGICQYHRDTLPARAMQDGLIAHRAIFINETLSLLNPHYALTNLTDSPRYGTALDEVISELCRKINL